MNDATKIPVISYDSLKRSSRIVKVFAMFYCPIQGIDVDRILDILPIMNYCAGVVYELDSMSEAAQDSGQVDKRLQSKYALLKEVLQEERLFDATVDNEIDRLRSYFQKESDILSNDHPSTEDLIEVLELRSSDSRLLHRLLFKSLGRPYDEILFRLFFPLEVIEEINDDLRQYHDDVADNRFNTVRILSKIFGKEADGRVLELLQHYEKKLLDDLNTVEEEQRKFYLGLYETFRDFRPNPEMPELNADDFE